MPNQCVLSGSAGTKVTDADLIRFLDAQVQIYEIVAMVPQVKALLLMPTGFVEPIEHRHDLLKIVGI
jgi:hypothetical protein